MMPDQLKKYYYTDLSELIRHLVLKSTYLVHKSPQFPKKSSLAHKKYIIFQNIIGLLPDVQQYFSTIHKLCQNDTRIIITYYNYLWEPLLTAAEIFKLKRRHPTQNWLTLADIENLLFLSNFSVIKKGQRFLFPFSIPIVAPLINNYIAKLPIINQLCLINYVIARPCIPSGVKQSTVSVIVPVRNESGNIYNLMRKLPKIGKSMELLFIEGHSRDDSWNKLTQLKDKFPAWNLRVFKQQGIGIADAVRLGVKKSTGKIIIILDADLSVSPQEISKFYNAMAEGKGEFINGSRLVYPLENQSMRFLNILGNKFFSLFFSWSLSQQFTDTLCGTKAFFRSDYGEIQRLRNKFGEYDPFGDFELIFGAITLHRKVLEIPIRYKARQYGQSNIHRFTHGLLLLKMSWNAFKWFKLKN